jgi:hypothetical protein
MWDFSSILNLLNNKYSVVVLLVLFFIFGTKKASLTIKNDTQTFQANMPPLWIFIIVLVGKFIRKR